MDANTVSAADPAARSCAAFRGAGGKSTRLGPSLFVEPAWAWLPYFLFQLLSSLPPRYYPVTRLMRCSARRPHRSVFAPSRSSFI